MNGLSESGRAVAAFRQSSDDLWRVYRTFLIMATLGLFGASLYSLSTNLGWAQAAAVLGGAMLVAGAFAFIGGLIGFVFAIPRSRQEERVVQSVSGGRERLPQRLSDYGANTNLEQISDWLTKILVGISLIQFGELSARFSAAGTTLAPMLGSSATARPVALAMMTYFMLWGFFFAYLSTRLWLPKALSRAERDEELRNREVESEAELRALEKQAYAFLYQAPPGGFTRAIDVIEAYQNKGGAMESAWLWLYLASALGQKHAFELTAGRQIEADEAKKRARAAVEQALKLNPGTRPILEQLYRGQDANENDLSTLQGDPRLDELLSK